MNRAKCAKLTQSILGRLAKITGLDRWRLEAVIGRCASDDAMAEVVVQWEYRRADFTVDPAKIDDEGELLATLAHEILHVALAPLEAWAPLLDTALADEAPLRRTLQTALVQAIEQSVVTLEPMLIALYRLEFE